MKRTRTFLCHEKDKDRDRDKDVFFAIKVTRTRTFPCHEKDKDISLP